MINIILRQEAPTRLCSLYLVSQIMYSKRSENGAKAKYLSYIVHKFYINVNHGSHFGAFELVITPENYKI
ncbi:hypothetical protein NIES4071_96220 [Calothrix sp. NIES-4071]|nr:hypothetical protein NIES4071_96220 [Calothrix sp. NIES-4071]BAZ63887.1 hypothetical protein NIES4105_96150 [Calothrix sp. NIES-4105]